MRRTFPIAVTAVAFLLATWAAPVMAADSFTSLDPGTIPAQNAAAAAPAEDVISAPPLTWYTTRGEFDGACPGLPLEDFENALAPAINFCAGPLDSASGGGGCYAPAELLPGFTMASSPTGGIVTIAPPELGVSSTVAGSNFFADDMDITFSPAVTAAGFDYVDVLSGATATISVYAPGDVLLGSMVVPSNTFVGISSSEPFDRIAITESFADLQDNLAFGDCGVFVFEKEITSGPDNDGDLEIDVVVPVKPGEPLNYDFTITFYDSGNPNVLVVDSLPAEWIANTVEGQPVDVDECGDSDTADGDHGTVDIYKNGKSGGKCKSATTIEWMPVHGPEADDDGIMWTTHGDGTRLGVIDTADALEVDIGDQGVFQSWAAAFDTNGDLYGTYNGFSGNAQLAIFDQGTGGIAATIGGLGTSLIALEVDAGGQMWGVGYNDSVLYRIDKSNALATPVGPTGITFTMDLAFAPDGTLYSTTGNVLYELHTGTGAVNDSMPINGILDGSVMGIAFDTNGRLFATAYVSDSPLYEIDPGTGNAGVVGPTTFFAPHGGDIYFDVGLPDLNVDSNTRPSPGKGHKGPVFAPTSCGPLYLNDGAIAYEKDEEDNLVLVDGEPVVVAGPTAPLCLAAVRQDLLDLLPEYDSDADHDGDTLSSHFEACEGVTDPCLADTDADGVNDDVDACPLEGPPDASIGELQEPDGCNRQSQCSDGADNDLDGPVDYPNDASCEDILDDTEDTFDV